MCDWAVRIQRDSYLGEEFTKSGAFLVEKETPKTLFGKAIFRDQHPKEECVWPLSKEEALALSERISGAAAKAKATIAQERKNLRSVLAEIRSGETQ